MYEIPGIFRSEEIEETIERKIIVSGDGYLAVVSIVNDELKGIRINSKFNDLHLYFGDSKGVLPLRDLLSAVLEEIKNE